MTPLQFAKIGELLFGPSWRKALADALNVAERTVRRWAEEGATIPDGIAADLAKLCRAHADKLLKAAERLEGMAS